MIGEKIKKIRTKKGMAQSAVAELAGISYVMIGMIERNQTNPSVSTLEKIAEALDCKMTITLTPKIYK